jgi:transcriptional regulator
MLTEKEKEVLKLKEEGFTQLEIAKKLGISQPAVSGFYNNAIWKIKDAEEILEIKKELLGRKSKKSKE